MTDYRDLTPKGGYGRLRTNYVIERYRCEDYARYVTCRGRALRPRQRIDARQGGRKRGPVRHRRTSDQRSQTQSLHRRPRPLPRTSHRTENRDRPDPRRGQRPHPHLHRRDRPQTLRPLHRQGTLRARHAHRFRPQGHRPLRRNRTSRLLRRLHIPRRHRVPLVLPLRTR